MGLEDTPEGAVGNIGCGAQGGSDLRGVMGVVVDDSDPAHVSLVLKAPVRSPEAIKRIPDDVSVYGQQVRQGSRGQGIVQIVFSGHLQGELPQGPSFPLKAETGATILVVGGLKDGSRRRDCRRK